MLQEYSELWSEVQVNEIIAQALNHTAVKKALNVELYVQGWLRRDAEKRRNNGKSQLAVPTEGYIPGEFWDKIPQQTKDKIPRRAET